MSFVPKAMLDRAEARKTRPKARRKRIYRATPAHIHRLWPYELWVRRCEPNPTGLYHLYGRAATEPRAIAEAQELQERYGRKVLVFFNPSPDNVRVLRWNDTAFQELVKGKDRLPWEVI